MYKKNIDSPLFIIGAQRSGTTIISLCLSNHPDVFLTVHGKLLYYLIQWIYYNFSSEVKHHLRFDEIAYSLNRRPILGVAPDMVNSIVNNINNGFSIDMFEDMSKQDIIRKVWGETYTLCANGKPVVGDKYNEYLLMLNEIVDIFPKAKFLFIKRNFIDSSESMVRHFSNRAFAPKTYEEGVVKWLQWNKKWVTFSQKIDERNKHSVKYEDMVLHPESEMRKICTFLSLKPEKCFIEDVNRTIDVKYNKLNNIKLNFNYIKKYVPDYEEIIHALGYEEFLN